MLHGLHLGHATVSCVQVLAVLAQFRRFVVLAEMLGPI
jgi:hypothetical protein